MPLTTDDLQTRVFFPHIKCLFYILHQTCNSKLEKVVKICFKKCTLAVIKILCKSFQPFSRWSTCVDVEIAKWPMDTCICWQ
jgi:hypothetical protein